MAQDRKIPVLLETEPFYSEVLHNKFQAESKYGCVLNRLRQGVILLPPFFAAVCEALYSLASMRRPCGSCKGRVFTLKMAAKVRN